MTESETALSRFAHETKRWCKERSVSDRDEDELPFPMYTVSWKVLREMTEVRPFEELMYDNCLTVFKEQMGKAFFVSHQWLANNHPDPRGEQLKVLQEALSNIMSGTSQVRIPLSMELLYGRVRTPKASDLEPGSLYIWYDYFSCPQSSGSKAEKQRKRAIDTIVSYVARCEYFVILCPELMHFDVGHLLGQESWAERGWCRTERLARELAAREDGFVILIESPMHQSLISNTRRHLDVPGKGFFTEETDRPRIAHVILQLVWRKLQYYLEQHDLPKYRFLLNTQEACCLANLGKAPLEGLVPDFRPTADPIADPQACVVERFLHENGFCSITERDKAGWTPLCYATMSGSPFVVTSLMALRADPNDKITKHKSDLLLPPKLSVLALAAHFRHGEVMQVLLEARADVMAVDGHYSVPLHWAASSDHVDGVKLLLDARADPEVSNFPGMNLFRIACFCGSHKVLKYLLQTSNSVDLQFSLHTSLMGEGTSNEVITTLLDAKADVNEQFVLQGVPALFRVIWALQRWRHLISPSSLTALAYHQSGATPLMFSVLNGYFGAAFLLLRNGADTQVRNGRQKTAADFARQVQAPQALLEVLEGRATVPPPPMLEAPPAEEDERIVEEWV